MSNLTDEVGILLVEDNPTDAELTMLALQERNLANHLVWVKDGAEALDFIFGAAASEGQRLMHTPRVIMLDLRLPKVDGLEVLRRLKSDDRAKQIPVVVLTSSKEDRDVVASYELGVNSYISKPVGFDDFSRVVSELGLYWLVVNHPPL